MDAAGVRTIVNLDGGWDQRLIESLRALDNAHPGRFLTYALVNFVGIDDANWSQRETRRLEASFKAGAKGLKIHTSSSVSPPAQMTRAHVHGVTQMVSVPDMGVPSNKAPVTVAVPSPGANAPSTS